MCRVLHLVGRPRLAYPLAWLPYSTPLELRRLLYACCHVPASSSQLPATCSQVRPATARLQQAAASRSQPAASHSWPQLAAAGQQLAAACPDMPQRPFTVKVELLNPVDTNLDVDKLLLSISFHFLLAPIHDLPIYACAVPSCRSISYASVYLLCYG